MVTTNFDLSAGTLTVAEGQSVTFTVALTQAPTIDAAVQLAVADGSAATISPQVLTFSAGDTSPKTITITGVEDNDLADESTTISVSAPNIAAGTIDLTVTDNDSQAIVAGSAAVTLTEGGSGTVGVHLAFQPSASTAVAISSADAARLGVSPATLTFTAANYASDQTLTLSAAEDADTAQDTVVATLSASNVTPVTVTATINDNDTQGVATSVAMLALTEGGADGTFQVTLNSQPTSTVTLNLASSDPGVAIVTPATLTFTAADYNQGASHIVTVHPADDNDTANESASITLSGGGLNATVPVTVADDDTQAIVTNPATTVNVGEGGTTTMGVSLAFDPGAQISVTVGSSDALVAGVTPTTLSFDSSNYSSEQQVTISGAQDDDLADDSTSVMLTATGISTKAVTVNVADDDTQAFLVSGVAAGNNLTLTEGTTANVGVRLAYQPASTVTVTIASSDETLLTSTPTTLQFTTANWNMAQPIALNALDENNLVNDSVQVSISDGGATSASLNVTILDNDVQGFFVMPATLPDLTEGGDTTFTVRLNVPPAAQVVATISSSNAKFLVNGGATTQVTIPAGNTAQTVTVHLNQDADAADESATISIVDVATVVPAINLPVTGFDDDELDFVVTPTTSDANRLEVVEESATFATFKVHLSAAPTGPTTVTVTPSATNTIDVSNNGTAFAATTTLAFDAGNYAVDQTVTIRGLADPNLVDELLTVTVGGAPLGAPDASVLVRKIEDDAQAIVTDPVQPGPINVVEGASKTLKVSLQYQPTQSVQVTVTPNHTDSDILVNGATTPVVLLFTTTNYASPQFITVTTPDDPDQIDPNGGTITVSSPALADRTINVGLTDDDDQSIVLSAPSASIVERDAMLALGKTSFKVKLAYIPTASPETVTLAIPMLQTDKLEFVDGAGMSLGATIALTFDAMTYSADQTVWVQAKDDNDVGDEDVVIALTSDRAPLLGQTPAATFAVHISDDDTLSLVFDNGMAQNLDEPNGDITPLVPPTTSHTWKVKLNHVPTTTVTVNFTSSNADAAAVSSGASLMFNAGNWDTYQDVVVDAVEDDDVRDETVTVTAASPGTDPNDPADVMLAVNVRDHDQQAFVTSGTIEVDENGSATLDVHLRHEPSVNLTVGLSYTNDTISGLASDQVITLNGAATAPLTFTSANWGADQPVVVASPEDVDLDHFTGQIHVVQSSAQLDQEAAAAADHPFAVRDNDTQSIVVTSDPIVLVNSAQEGGPAVKFKVKLSHRPRLGLTDTVHLFGPGNVRFTDTGADSLDVAFDGTNWNTEVEVWWYAHEYGTNDNYTGDITLDTLGEDQPAGDQVPPFGAEDLNAHADHAVRVLDDDTQQVVNESDYLADGYNGATNFTQRSNIAFLPDGTAEGRVVFTARSATEGGTGLLGFSSRALAPVTAGPQFATAGLEPTTEIVLPASSGDAWDVFASSSEGIVYNRFSLTGSPVGSQIVIAPASANATDFSVAQNGDVYGVIYRRQETSRNNLYFRTLDLTNGMVSGENVSTTANSLVHFHPTLLATPGYSYDPGTGAQDTPWAVTYTSNDQFIVARLGATGTQVGITNLTVDADIPGTFTSAVWASFGRIVAANATNDPQWSGDGEYHVWLWSISLPSGGQAAALSNAWPLTSEPFTPVSPPTIASNGAKGDFAVAYDSSLGGKYTVNVALFNYNSGPRDYRLDGDTNDEGVFPSITWAVDRWVLRYQATSPTSSGIRLRTGSFEGDYSGTLNRQPLRGPTSPRSFMQSQARVLD